MKNNNKKNKKCKINEKYYFLILVFICAMTSISLASNVIYSSQTNNKNATEEYNMYADPYYLETTKLEPYAETYEEPTGVRVADNLKKFGEYSSKTSKAIIRIWSTQ